MRPFRDLPIARKALTLGLVPTVFALIVAILASLVTTYITARRNQHVDVESQATVVADNLGAGLTFRDKRVVDQIVGALRVRPNIDMVCVYDDSGHLFSQFQRPRFACPPQWPAATPATVPVAVQRAMAGNDSVGTVFIQGNYSGLFAWMRRQSLVAFLALACGFLVAVLLTHHLRRYLSTPIVELSSTLNRVATSGDYSTRAHASTGDEVGRLVESFNTMLEVIQKKDIERDVLLQKSQESNRIKDEFLATVSHELRTPLNAMLGWLQIIRTTSMDSATFEKAMSSIERNAQSQARVVEDLLELSRVVTGKLHLKTKPVDVRSVVEASLDVVRTAAQAKGVSLRANLAGSAVMVSGDRDRLQQVVWNLLSNAVKFTDSGGTVTVDLTGDDRNCVHRHQRQRYRHRHRFSSFIFSSDSGRPISRRRASTADSDWGWRLPRKSPNCTAGSLKASRRPRTRQPVHNDVSTPALPPTPPPAMPNPSNGRTSQGNEFSSWTMMPRAVKSQPRPCQEPVLAITEAGSGHEALEQWQKAVLRCAYLRPCDARHGWLRTAALSSDDRHQMETGAWPSH